MRTELASAESAWTTSVLQVRAVLGAVNRELAFTKQSLGEALRIAHAELESTKFELDYANHRIDDLHASTSWRVTKPVRTLAASLEKARHHPTES